MDEFLPVVSAGQATCGGWDSEGKKIDVKTRFTSAGNVSFHIVLC